MDVLSPGPALVDYLADTLVELGEGVPTQLPTFNLDQKGNPFIDQQDFDIVQPLIYKWVSFLIQMKVGN